jgi:hypothetical protein
MEEEVKGGQGGMCQSGNIFFLLKPMAGQFHSRLG